MATTIPFSDGSGSLTRHADIVPQQILPRFVDIWVPPDLAAGVRLPVIYMHDGQNLFDSATGYAGVDWGIDEAMLRVMADTGLPGAVVVGVWNSQQRWRDYGPQAHLEALHGTPEWETVVKRAGGPLQSDAYLCYLVEELKPLVDAAYPTLPSREHTFVMGSSMGGLISLYAVERYPEVFGGAACVSTHWSAGGDRLVDSMGAALPRAGHHRLYFDYGTKTLDQAYEPFQLRMDGHLVVAGYRRGVDWVTEKFPGAEHSERSWRERAHIPLRFLLAG
jgi:predicted alpha/beta superfamily hydrolase